MKMMKTKEKHETSTGSIPVCATTSNQPFLAFQQVTDSGNSQERPANIENSPQIVPTPDPVTPWLSRRDLRDLIRYCDEKIGRCSLMQEEGRRARELREKLIALHAYGWRR